MSFVAHHCFQRTGVRHPHLLSGAVLDRSESVQRRRKEWIGFRHCSRTVIVEDNVEDNVPVLSVRTERFDLSHDFRNKFKRKTGKMHQYLFLLSNLCSGIEANASEI